MIIRLPQGAAVLGNRRVSSVGGTFSVTSNTTTSNTTTADNTLFGYPVIARGPEPETRDAYEQVRDAHIAALRERLAVTRTPIKKRDGYTSIDKRRDFSEEPDAWKVRSPRVFR